MKIEISSGVRIQNGKEQRIRMFHAKLAKPAKEYLIRKY